MRPGDNSLEGQYEDPVNTGILQSTPEPMEPMVVAHGPGTLLHYNKWAVIAVAVIAMIVIGAGVATLALAGFHGNKQNKSSSQQITDDYGVKDIALSDVSSSKQLLGVTQASKLSINGELQVGNTLVLKPTNAPSSAKAGQIYYDKVTNMPYYYNGTTFVALTSEPGVRTFGGSTGAISLGSGLQLAGNQLSVTNDLQQGSSAAKVTSLQGKTGDVVFAAGDGIAVNGTTISNTGITKILAGAGLGLVQNAGEVTLSLPQLLGAADTPTFNGVQLNNALSIASGGTNTNGVGFTSGGVFYYDGTSFVTAPTPAGTGLCFLSGPTGPYFGSCSGASSGVISVNGITSVVVIDNATTNVGTGHITIQDSSTSQKGIAQFSGTDFNVTAGSVTLATSVTKAGNTFNGSGQLIKLDTAGQSSAAGQCLLSTAGGTAFSTCPVGGNLSSGASQTPGALTKFDTTTNRLTDSIASESGSVLTVIGTVTASGFQGGGANLTNLNANNISTGTLGVTRGGTGQTSFAANSILIGNGSAGIGTLSAGNNGDCLVIAGGAPTFTTCTGAGGVSSLNSGTGAISLQGANGVSVSTSTGGVITITGPTIGAGVTSVNGLSGALTVADATAAGSTITINTASTSQKGIASYNSTNFSVASGVVNTIQGIGTSATPTFSSLILQSATTAITGTGTNGTTKLQFATQSGNDTKTITVPNATGTVAVNATGPLSIDANGTLTCATCLTSGGGGAGGVSSVNTITGAVAIAGANGITVSQSGNTITVTAPTTATGVSSLNGLNGALAVANATAASGTITINDASTSAKGIASFNSSDFSVSSGAVSLGASVTKAGNTFNGVNQLLQLDANGYIPTLNGSQLTTLNASNITSGTLSVARGGTGAGSFTSYGVLYGNGTSLGSTAVGTTGQCLVATTGAAPSFQTCTGAGGVSSVNAQTGALLLNAGTGIGISNVGPSFTIANSGVTGLQGTANQVTASGSTGNITLSLPQNIDTAAAVQFASAALTGTNGLTLGQAATTTGSLNFKNASNSFTTSLKSGVPSANLAFTLPSSDGASGQCLVTNASGTLSFANCLSGSSGGSSGVSSVQGGTSGSAISGALTISNSTTSGSTVTLDTATTAVKGIASFSSSDFSVSSGAVSLGTVSIAKGGTGITAAPGAMQLLIGNASGTAYSLGTFHSTDSSVTFTQDGTGINVQVPGASNIGTCASCANAQLSNLSATAVNADLTPATTNTVNVGSAAKQFANGYFANVATASINLTNGSSSRTVTLQGSNPSGTGNAVISIPTIAGGTSDTICLATLANCSGSNGGSGNTNYIFNQSTQQASSNFNVSGTGTATTLNATGALQFNGANINTAGTLTNVAYQNQANTFTAANTFSAAGTALSVTNNATIGGTLGVTGAITSGTVNGQTISNTASFTGTLAVGGATSINSTLSVTGGINGAGLTNSGSTLNSALVLGDFASGGSVGSAATTVDTHTTISIAQTTAGQTVTFPTPTITTAGRLLYILNTGSQAFTASGVTVPAGYGQMYIWNGTTWILGSAGGTTSVTLQGAYDGGNVITTSNARNLTVTLADTATDANFITNIATSSTGQFKVQNNGTDVFTVGSAGQVALSAQGSTGGIAIGGDTQLYRSAANRLQANSALTLRNTSDSTTALQIQNASGTDVFTVDTTNKSISVGAPISSNSYSYVGGSGFSTKVDYATGAIPQSVTSADFNGDGKADLATANNNSDTVSVFMNSGTGTFAAKVDYATGTAPQSVTSADFNGDGKPDLAVVNNNTNTVSVLMNNGTGTFAAKVDYTTGSSPQTVTAADFNGDGKADIAITNYSDNTVSVLMNNGTGTFAAKVDYATGNSPRSSTAADFNGDGKLDLAIANGSASTISVLINNGTGTFATKVDYATGSGPFSVTAADFNGDGKPDLATANNVPNTVSVFINNGTGTFATKVDYAGGNTPNAITAADFNGDGKADLAETNNFGADLSVLMNNGTGTFATNVNYPTGSNPRAITAADFNGDGKADLAVANGSSSTMSVLMNAATLVVTTMRSTASITSSATNSTALTLQGIAGQSTDILRVQDSSANALFTVASNGNVGIGDVASLAGRTEKLTVTGAANITGTVNGQTLGAASVFTGSLAVQGATGLTIGVAGSTQGKLILASSGTGSVTLQSATQSNGLTLLIPTNTNTSDTLCLVTLANCSGSGVSSIGTINGQTKSANGAVVSGNSLYLQTADATYPGLVSTSTQSFAGDKTFTGNLIVPTKITAGTASGVNTVGTNLNIEAGNGTGEGGSGNIILSTAAGQSGFPAIGAATPDGSQYKNANNNTGSFSHTVPSGTNRMLLVALMTASTGSNATSVTYGGVAMTQVPSASIDSVNNISHIELWYLLNPTVGTGTVTANFSGYRNVLMRAVTVNGVNQTTPFGTACAVTGLSSTSGCNVSTGAYDRVVDVTSSADAYTGLGAGQTSIWANDQQTRYMSMSYRDGTGGTTNNTRTYAANTQWVTIGVPIKSASNFASTSSDTMVERLRVTNTGFVGINNNNPQYALDVVGDINASGNLLVGGSATVSGALSVTTTLAVTGAATFASTVGATGNINTAANLQTGGTTRITSAGILQNTTLDTNGTTLLVNTTGTPGALVANSVGRVSLTTTNSTGLCLLSNGATTAPTFQTCPSATTTSAAFQNGGNTYGATATLGLNDAQTLNIIQNATTRISLSSAGNINLSPAANYWVQINTNDTDSTAKLTVGGIIKSDTGFRVGANSGTSVAACGSYLYNMVVSGGIVTAGTCATGSSTAPYTQGGNAFGSTATLGNTDNFALNIVQNNTARIAISQTGNIDLNPGTNLWVRINTTNTDSNAQLIVGGKIKSTSGYITDTYTGMDLTCGSANQTIGALQVHGGIVTAGSCQTNNSDLAENYNSSDNLTPGELVMTSTTAATSVNRATATNETKLMGVVSTNPGKVLGTEQVPNGYPIALSGRVPVKVNTEGGAIEVGDKITISSVPGVGKRATGAGMIVGTAVEAFNGTGTGSIEVFVNLSYYEPPVSDMLQAGTGNFGNLNISGNVSIGGTLSVVGLVSVHDISISGHIITTSGQPTTELQVASGTDATMVIDGNDTTGTITITTGSAPTAGEMSKILFSELYGKAPHVVLSPSNDHAVDAGYFKGVTTTDGFMLNFKNAPLANTTYQFDYFISQ